MTGLPDDDEKTSIQAIPLDSTAPNEQKSGFLLIVSTQSELATGRMFKLGKNETVLGRGAEADFQIADDGISRRHAKIVFGPDAARLVDLDSTNGTFINGERVKQAILKDGDKVQLGSTTVLLFSLQSQLEEQLQRNIYEAATRDGLTQAYNKKYFIERVRKEIAYSARHQLPMALLMFDVDHFKKVNDTYGHQAGDRVLVNVARRVSDVVRTEDLFARYGGEEFAILLRDSTRQEATACGERCREAVDRMQVQIGNTPVHVTISVGVAILPKGSQFTAQELIAAADKRLYQAKAAGRNRVCADE